MMGLRIGHRLAAGFAMLILLSGLLGLVAYLELQQVVQISTRIHDHPLAVSNAVMESEAQLNGIQRAMKDVLLAQEDPAIRALVEEISTREAELRRQLEKTEAAYMGDPADVQRVRDAVDQWRPVRAEAIHLVAQGEIEQATAVVQGPSARHLAEIRARQRAVTDATRAYAHRLRTEGQVQRVQASQRIVLMLTVTLLLGSALGTLITRSITRPLARIRDAMTAIAQGQGSVEIVDRNRADAIGHLANAAHVFMNVASQARKQQWVDQQISQLSQRVQDTPDAATFADRVVRQLANALSASRAVLFIVEGDQLVPHGSFGIRDAPTLRVGEGPSGQCASSGEYVLIDDLPPDFIRVRTGLGSAQPTTLICAPVRQGDRVLAVLEIARFKPLTDTAQRLLDEALPLVSVLLDNMQRAAETRELLAHSRSQAAALGESQQELTRYQEALELRQSEVSSRNAELHARNRELHEHSTALADRTKALEAAKRSLEAQSEQVRRASRTKSEFLANMSHELRTPLNSILLLARSLRQNSKDHLDAREVEAARVIHDSGSQLLHLINDILDLSHVESGKLTVSPKPVTLIDIADRVRATYAPQAAEKDLTLHVDVDPALPEVITTDPNRLQQVVDNLIGNALKFTHAGSVRLTIGPPAEDHGVPADWISINVSDDGIGIDDAHHARIFNAFEQVDSTSRRSYGGTGLGLAISAHIARLLGGQLRLKSQLGVGSTFYLLLPRAPATATSTAAPPLPAPPEPEPSVDEPMARFDGELVLVADADMRTAFALASGLRARGLRIRVAKNGAHALDLLYAHPDVRLALVEAGLETPGGESAISRIRATPLHAELPIIALVPAHAPNARALALQAGATRALDRPLDVHAVAREIRPLLSIDEPVPTSPSRTT